MKEMLRLFSRSDFSDKAAVTACGSWRPTQGFELFFYIEKTEQIVQKLISSKTNDFKNNFQHRYYEQKISWLLIFRE